MKQHYELWVITLGKICTHGKCPEMPGDEPGMAENLEWLKTSFQAQQEAASRV